jgi:transposase
MNATANPAIEVSMDEVETIIAQAQALGLPEEHCRLLRRIVESYSVLLGELGDQKMTIQHLRELVFGAQTEKRREVLKNPDSAPEKSTEKKEKCKPKGHGRAGAETYTGAKKVKVPHESLRPGDPCPLCKGKVYRKNPRRLVRIRGAAPFQGTVYEQECLRCNLCGEVFTAKAPPGVGEEKFDETVASMVGVLRYGSGLPMNRIAGLQKAVGVPLPVSTQWDLVNEASEKMKAAHDELIRQGAQGEIFYNDDTPMTILEYLAEKKRRREQGAAPLERTGTFTSGIVSQLPNGRKVVLYFTGRLHAGENLADVLAKRASGLDQPMQMCDGLDRNLPGEIKTLLANCLVHARRQFVKVAESFPAEVEHVINELARVYRNESLAKSKGLSGEERLKFHQEQSQKTMDDLRAWMESLLTEKKVEPNSGLGKAIHYASKRWEKLTLFLREPGAPLDNNLTERMLKRAILHRKNSMFYKTENGARVGDLYMSLIATAKLAKVDPFDYLNQLQRHAEKVAANPSGWMPWNYRSTIEGLASSRSELRKICSSSETFEQPP